MFWAKAAQHSYHTIFEPTYRAYSQNQKTDSPSVFRLHLTSHLLKNGNDSHLADHHPHLAHPSRTSTESEEDHVKMSRSNNNGKRHKNHAGHKASKHRKNNKGNKANNHNNSSHHATHGKRRINRAPRGTGEAWYALAAMQGRRPHMEDTYSVVIPDASGPAGGDLHSLFGVFDGHGGKKVSQFLKDNLLPAIVEAYAQEKAAEEDDPDQRTPAERLQAILPRTFLRIDERAMADDQLSGSTAVVAILTENDIVVANVGDSRGILYRSNEAAGQRMRESGDSGYDSSNDASLHSTASEDDATEDATDEENDTDTDEDLDDAVASTKGAKKQQQQKHKPDGSQKKKKRKYKKKPEEGPVGKIGRWQALSVDHKPNRPDERERVERCGGRVTKRTNDVWRFQSVLAVSRAFGDHGLKVGAGGSALTANPEIKIFTRQENDKFFVLASDGLWDVYTNEQAAKVGRNVLLQNPKNPAQAVADALTNGAYEKESLDNITTLVVLLDDAAVTHSSPSALTSSSESGSAGGDSSEGDDDATSAPNSPPLSARSRHSEL